METTARIKPTLLDRPTAEIADVVTELAARTAVLGRGLHPRAAGELAALVRTMNGYYGAGSLDAAGEDPERELKAQAQVRVQAEVDGLAAAGTLPPAASTGFLRRLHAALLPGAGEAGRFRDDPDVTELMQRFEERYELSRLGAAGRIMAVPAAHHRLLFIRPFADGNGRVARLMSHAMAAQAGIGAHGLWSVSRGLARGLHSRGEYRAMLARADQPPQGEADGRGGLSLTGLQEFVLWFLRVALAEVGFMAGLLDLENLVGRLKLYVDRSGQLRPEAFRLLEAAAIRGEIARGDAARLTGLPERTARIVLAETVAAGLLASDTPKGPVSLRFPARTLDLLFPQLFPRL